MTTLATLVPRDMTAAFCPTAPLVEPVGREPTAVAIRLEPVATWWHRAVRAGTLTPPAATR